MPSSMMKNFMWSNLPSDFFWRAIFHITSYYHRQYVNNWEVVIPYPSFRLNDGQGGLNFTGIQLIQLDSFWWATPSHYGHFHRENDDWPVDLEWLGAFPKPIWVAGYIEVIYPISLWNGWFPRSCSFPIKNHHVCQWKSYFQVQESIRRATRKGMDVLSRTRTNHGNHDGIPGGPGKGSVTLKPSKDELDKWINDMKWCQMMSNDVKWCPMMSNDVRWC